MPKTKATALYLSHFELREAPFKITPTTEFFYGGGQRGEILHALLYAIDVGEGIMAVTGEVGSGKTMLLRTMLDKLQDGVDIIYIANPSLSGREILYNICEELGLQAAANRPDTVRLLQNTLVERHAAGRRVIAFIDEAQAMPDESLEEIRLLSNLETSRDKLLQIVLFGQPEFEDKLSQQKLRQLRERITVWLKLKPFGRDDVREYIATRLRAAGHNGAQLFNDEACSLIATVSQGLSRRINVLADKSLLSAYERNALSVNYADARRAVRDVNFGKMRYRTEQSKRLSRQLTIGVAAAAALLLAVAAGVRLHGGGAVTPAPAEEVEVAVVATAAAVVEPLPSAATVSAAPAHEEVVDVTEVAPAAEENDAVAAPQEEEVMQEAMQHASVAEQIMWQEEEEVIDDTEEGQVALAATVPAAAPAAPAPVAEAVLAKPSVVVHTVIHTVVQTVQPPRLQEDAGTGGREEMLAAISELSRGEAAFNGEQFAEQIAENAEQHTDEPPQTQGGGNNWQQTQTAALPPGLVDNARWEWMPASSYLRGRLNATQTWLQEEGDSDAYTVRLITVSQERAVFLERFLRYFYDFYPIRNTMVYPLRLQRGDMFVVTFGIYPSRNEAEVFIRNVPYYFTGGKPFAQKLSTSLAEARQAWGDSQ